MSEKKKKQSVFKIDLQCPNCHTDIFKKVGKIKGVTSLVLDPEKKTLTVIGTVEPTPVFKALKKIKQNPEVLTVGAPKPKCRYCKYFVCACGIARFPARQPTELAPPPPGWQVPPPCTEDGGWCQLPPCPPPDSCCPTAGNINAWPPPPPPPPCTPGPGWCPQPPTPYPYFMQPEMCDLIGVYPPEPRGICSIM